MINEFWSNLSQHILDDPRFQDLLFADKDDKEKVERKVPVLFRNMFLLELAKQLKWFKKYEFQDLLKEDDDDKIVGFIRQRISEKKVVKIYSKVKNEIIAGLIS